MTLVTELANTGVIAGVYGSSTSIPVFTVDEDGRLVSANTTAVAGVDNFSYSNANNTISLETGDGSIFNIQTETTVELTGKVTGSATSSSGTVSIIAELANTGVIAGVYGSATQIPVITIDEDGRITVANTSSVSGVENFYWNSANNTLTLETGDGSTYNVIVNEFADITANDITANNIIVSGVVDGRDIAADGLKLDGIEDNATADKSASEILSLLLTVDGANSGLDADLLDGYQYEDIVAAASSNIGDGTVTISGTGALSGSGTFNLNDFGNTSITISHSDTSTQTSVNNSGRTYIQDITLDTYGHITSLTSATETVVDTNTTYDISSVTTSGGALLRLTESGSGSGTDDVKFADGNAITVAYTDINTITINHNDTSTQSSVNNSGRTYIQDITLDTYGHITSLTSATETVVDTNTTYDISSVTTSGGALLRLTESGSGSGTDDVKFADGNAITVAYTDINTITINHADTSSVVNINSDNSNGIVIQDFAATFDTYGHVQTTSVATINLDSRYYTETELNAGQLNNLYYTETELDNGQLDNRYYTETESDTRFVNVTGDTMTGALTVQSVINQNHSTFISSEATTTSTAQTVIYSFAHASYGSAEITITAKEGSNRHMTKLLITHNGSTAIATEYGTVFTGSQLAQYDVAIVGAALQIQSTAATASSTNFKIVGTLLVA
jgi:hypothetical protein